MPTIYDFEIQSYRRQIESMQTELENIDLSSIDNLTHYGLARSNRANFMVVGLCGLVEAKLFEIVEKDNNFNLKEINSSGLGGLVDYMKELNVLDFGKLKYWDSFCSTYKIRNSIVHSYGGLITNQNPSKIKNHFRKLNLNLPQQLVADRRIRLQTDSLEKITDIIENLIEELNQYAT